MNHYLTFIAFNLAVSGKKKILVAVLDWGLGHASRSIPVIAELLRQDVEVIMASSGRAGLLLQMHYPELLYLDCPAYDVHYRGVNLYWGIFRQLPKIYRTILKEKRWFNRVVRSHGLDAVISDSRFGCYQASISSVMLTHQLQLQLHPHWLSKIVNYFYKQWLSRFKYIWVPDKPGGLSGVLSSPSPFPQTTYLGCISRFCRVNQPLNLDLLILLSGPEPQRTYLEERILAQLKHISEIKVKLVQGITDQEKQWTLKDHIEVVSYLSGDDLQQALAESEIVLCRSGYSSLMDLAAMQKQAIIVPTPGQPEQEYLADRCQMNDWAVVVPNQSTLDIKEALIIAHSSKQKVGFPQLTTGQVLKKSIAQFLKNL